jgi:hypothetical protein
MTPEKVALNSNGAPNYQRLSIVYDVKSDAAALDQPPAVRPVSYSQDAATTPPTGRFRLEVQYPYPGVHRGFARATLRIVTDTIPPKTTGNIRPRPSRMEEALVLDLPKSQLDALLKDLAADGFFKRSSIPGPQSTLAVTYNRGRVEKGWNREQRLDDLIEMLRHHGTPVAIAAPR